MGRNRHAQKNTQTIIIGMANSKDKCMLSILYIFIYKMYLILLDYGTFCK